VRKSLEVTLGVILVILGIIGGLLPVIQGWMFMIPGLILLSHHLHIVRRLLHWFVDKVETRNPKLAQMLREKVLHRHREEAGKQAGPGDAQ
jgi:uncharacterized protein YqgC (DUF456 family)